MSPATSSRTRRPGRQVRGPVDPPAPTRAVTRSATTAAAVVVALLGALAVALAATGAAAPSVLADPGAGVRWGLPAARAVADLAAAVTLGGLVLVAGVLPARSPAAVAATRLALAAAVTWTVAGGFVLLLTAADVTGRPLGTPGSAGDLGVFVTDVDLGRQLAFVVLGAALVATVVAGVRGPGGAAASAVLVGVVLVPLALTGHAAGAADHEVAVSAWWLHVLAVGVWAGGLAALAAVAGSLGTGLAAAASRFSVLAGWAYALLVATGVATAATRLGTWADVLSSYGLLVLAKTAAALALGVAGWWHRRVTLTALAAGAGAAFRRLVAGEVLVMAGTIGVAVALSRTAAPVPDVLPTTPTPAEVVTGEPLPPPPTALRYLTEASWDVLWVAAVAVLVVAYLLGVRRLTVRGDRWPVGRTLTWLAGCAALLAVTSSGLARYADVLFSAHMVQHMALSMVVPPLLVLGAPVTLALRALPRSTDGARGPREWVQVLVGSRVARVATQPVVAAVVFTGSLIVFYYSELFGLALRTHVGHELMMIHFLLAGYLFALVLVGVDPGVKRPPYPLRLVLLFATMAFHAFFGVALLTGDAVLEADYFSSLGWGIDVLADQRDGGAVAWAVGEIPTLGLAMLVAVQWYRSDVREARRVDRAADRDHDADLTAYNAMLGRLAEQDRDPAAPAARDTPSR